MATYLIKTPDGRTELHENSELAPPTAKNIDEPQRLAFISGNLTFETATDIPVIIPTIADVPVTQPDPIV